jgi:hypothetical protein
MVPVWVCGALRYLPPGYERFIPWLERRPRRPDTIARRLPLVAELLGLA